MLRLQIVATGQFLVLPPDAVLTLEQNTTLFNPSDDLLGSVSYGGTLPLQPNRLLLQNGHLLSSPNRLRTLPVRIWLAYLPWKEVTFTWTVENQTINYELTIDQATIANQFKTLTLNQLSTPSNGQNLPVGTPAQMRAFMLATATEPPGTYPMVFFPVRNDGAYKEDAYTSYDAYNGGVVYQPGQTFIYGKQAYKVVTATNKGDTPLSVPAKFTNISLVPGDVSQPVSPYYNAWQLDSEGNGSFVVDDDFPIGNTQVPAYTLPYLLKQVVAFFGYTYEGTWLDDPDNQRIVLLSAMAVLQGVLPSFDYFMPAVTVSDFIKTVRTKFGLIIDFDATRKVCLVESLDYLRGTQNIVDLRGCQQIGFRELDTQPTGYTITEGVDDNDSAFSDQEKAQLPSLVLGDGTEDVELSSVQTKMLTEVSPTTVSNAQWRLPYLKQQIDAATPMDQVSEEGYADRNKFSLRFLYYYGMQPDAAGYLYPYASSDNTGPTGASVGSYTLSLAQQQGVNQVLQRRYEYLLNSRPFEMSFVLRKEDYVKITAGCRILVRDWNQATISCLLDQNAADLKDQPDIFAKLTLYPEIIPPNTTQEIYAGTPPTDPQVPPVDNGLVYVKLVLRNFSSQQFQYPPPGRIEFYEDIVVQFFADSQGTVPKSVINLPVRLQTTVYRESDSNSNVSNYTYTGNGTETVLQAKGARNVSGNGQAVDYTYQLLADKAYTIIQ